MIAKNGLNKGLQRGVFGLRWTTMNYDSGLLLAPQHEMARASGPFFSCPEQAKHLRASRQDSKGIRCNGCRGRACVTETLLCSSFK
jgi:hypothetical protein